MLDILKKTLLEVDRRAGDDFSGVGVIVYENIKKIPLFPLHQTDYSYKNDDLASMLIEISNLENPHHDGFHLINNSLKITHSSQYFSPQIIHNLSINRTRDIGGRYMAAIFGSCLQGVLFTGIVTKTNGPIIFQNGVEILLKEKL